MGTFNKLWVDANAPCPNDSVEWTRAPTLYEAMLKCELIPFTEVAICKDIKTKVGCHELRAEDFVQWLHENQIDCTITYHK